MENEQVPASTSPPLPKFSRIDAAFSPTAGTPSGSETNTESSFGSSSSFNASNPFSDSSSSFGDASNESSSDFASPANSVQVQPNVLPDLKSFANNFDKLDGILNHFNAAQTESNTVPAPSNANNANTKNKAFNPFAVGRTKSPALNELKGMEFTQSMPEAIQTKSGGSNQVNYEALRETGAHEVLNNTYPMQAQTQSQAQSQTQAMVNDKAAMDFFKDAAAAAFSEFGGAKRADPFSVNRAGPFSNGMGNGCDGVTFNGKVIFVKHSFCFCVPERTAFVFVW